MGGSFRPAKPGRPNCGGGASGKCRRRLLRHPARQQAFLAVTNGRMMAKPSGESNFGGTVKVRPQRHHPFPSDACGCCSAGRRFGTGRSATPGRGRRQVRRPLLAPDPGRGTSVPKTRFLIRTVAFPSRTGPIATPVTGVPRPMPPRHFEKPVLQTPTECPTGNTRPIIKIAALTAGANFRVMGANRSHGHGGMEWIAHWRDSASST